MINVQICDVAGETYVSIQTISVGQALKFLDRYDHEGSGLVLTLRADDAQAYAVLRAIDQWETPRATA